MARIGYILKVYPRFSETFVVTEILAREAAGDDISIFALRPTTDARFHPELARVKAEVQWIARPTSANSFWQQFSTSALQPVITSNLVRILPELASLSASDVAQAITLAQAALDQGISHLHAHFASLAGRLAWVASQLTGIPYTVTTHAKDIFHDSIDQVWLRRICADAHRVIAISRFNETYLKNLLAGSGARIELQYNALELERFPYRHKTPPQAGSPLKLLAVGRLVPKKGFAYLLEAVKILQLQGTDFSLKIAGSGELEEQLRAQITRLGLTEEVSLLGPCTQEEVRQLIYESDLFVAPCIPAEDGNIDGLPTVVLEAMACGSPVVATAVTGLPEVIRDGQTGILLEAANSPALAEALTQVAQAKIDTAPLAKAARTLIEESFDSRKQAQTLSQWESAPEASFKEN